MGGALAWLNLYGCETVQHKPKTDSLYRPFRSKRINKFLKNESTVGRYDRVIRESKKPENKHPL